MPKQYTVKNDETLGIIAKKFNLPTWKYLYQLNKDVIGDNPDILKKGIVLNIPEWETSYGAKLIKDKGAEPSTYLGGLSYIYPWAPVSFTLANPDGTVYREFDKNGNELAEFTKKKRYEIRDAESGKVLVTGEISKSEEIRVMVPNVKKKILVVDGKEYRLWEDGAQNDKK